ncbi:hypothetical protein [Thalassoroseus pseudoceratinae]|uniref:hypothetical protein n=1 Tax=Thalassoroseus pseudoceratinae TaxID=2713176 RepID=UPI0014228A52|nr:hypothetical protein [Thalassoroseus pseudoceratinae]
MRKPMLILLTLFLSTGFVDHSAAKDAAKPPIPAANKNDLQQAVGQEISVLGEVARTGKSSSGHVFLNFVANGEFVTFIPRDVVAKFPKNSAPTSLQGQNVVVRGRLERFRGKLQIRLQSADRLQIIKRKPGKQDKLPEPVKLKSLGRDTWISPAGVRYSGRDPNGLTRKAHVLRHARDIPNRDGPHGVFDGGDDVAFAWIDEAWKKIKTDRIRPQSDDGRDVYTVSMGRRVGFLGGKTGAERNHPALRKIFIVVRKGTSEVITAFPR